MKKKVLMALLLGACVTLAGCSQKTETTEKTTEAVTENAAGEEETGSEASTGEGSTEASSEVIAESESEYQALDYVTLGQYTKLEVTVSSLDVTEEEIESQYYTDCSTNDKLLQVTEGTVADGDVVNIDYVGSVDGEEFDGGTDKGVDLTIGSGTFIPGFEEGLIGAEIGKEIDLNVTFPENYRSTDLAGKDAVFAVTVNYVNKAPEMTDEIVSEISTYKTVAEYRENKEAELKTTKEATRESEIINGVLNLVYSGSKINDYPADVVAYRTAQMENYYKQIAEQAGMEFADFLEQQLQVTEEEFENQLPELIKQSMIQELLLKAVAESEKMEITDEEYEAGLEKYVSQTGAESKETLLSQYSEEEVRKSILMDKALQFLEDNAVIKEEGAEDETNVEEESEGPTTETTEEAESTEAATEAATESDTEAAEAETTEAVTEETTAAETE